MIPFRTGNLGVARLHAARSGRPHPDPDEERGMLPAWRAQGFDAVEDYVAWELVEPEPGRFDWTLHRENARAAERAGLVYVVYPWVHAAPRWHRDGDAFVAARCLEHGRDGPAPSPFAASTWACAERFWRAVATGLGDVSDGVVGAFPADYGEVGCLTGVAGWLLGDDPLRDHQHTGLWCGDPEAARGFAEEVRARHRTPRRLGEAWALPPDEAWAHCPWPGPLATEAHRLDFARFYCGAVTLWTGRLLGLLAELFPRVPREIKLGHLSEALELGTDWHALVAAAARTGTIVRFTGGGMGELFTRRVASLCAHHGARFATEAPREIAVSALRERLFTDIASGTTAYFEFPEQLESVRTELQGVAPAFGRPPRRPLVACAYPTRGLRLAPGRGAPLALAHAFPAIRRLCDVTLLDERQIASGALQDVACLLWLDGEEAIPCDALVSLRHWVERGGVLVSGLGRRPGTCEPCGGDGDGASVAGGGAGRGGADAMARLMEPVRHGLHYRLDGVIGGVVLHPGEPDAHLYLGPGWHGREDGAWAFEGAGGSVPCRWTADAAAMLLPRPSPWPLELLLEARQAPGAPDGPVSVRVDGVLAGTARCRAGEAVRIALPPPGPESGAMISVRIACGTHRPHSLDGGGDHRDLGLLVRRVAVVRRGAGWDDASTTAALAGALSSLRCGPAAGGPAPASDASPAPVVRRLGHGVVLAGDGTPLAALGWLGSWLARELPDGVPSDRATAVVRDRTGSCLVTELAGGLLLHNPGSERAASPDITGVVATADAPGPVDGEPRGPGTPVAPIGPLAPLETRWLPQPAPGGGPERAVRRGSSSLARSSDASRGPAGTVGREP